MFGNLKKGAWKMELGRTFDFACRRKMRSSHRRMGYVILAVAFLGLLVAFLYKQKVEKLRQRASDVFDLKKSDVDQQHTSALFVTSHPDDECMFFGPTIRHLVEKNITVHVLCLSTGNFYGLGETRRVELLNACLKLGVFPSQLHQLEHFHDDLYSFWDTEQVAKTVDKFVELVNPKAIFTFDEGGVSGHKNHISTSKGVQKIESQIPIYKLITVNPVRKFVQLFDILLSTFNQAVIASSLADFKIVYNAMTCHKSQLTILTRLYMTFSRYLVINTWCRVR